MKKINVYNYYEPERGPITTIIPKEINGKLFISRATHNRLCRLVPKGYGIRIDSERNIYDLKRYGEYNELYPVHDGDRD